MIFSEAGRKFLEEYNKEHDASYTPEQFFEEVFYPLFFEVGEKNKKLMPPIHNDPFNNIKSNGNPLESFKEEVHKSESYSGSYVLGNPSNNYKSGNEETYYRGLVSLDFSDPRTTSDADDVYLSWIGICFAISINANKRVLFNDVELYKLLFKGFEHYRKFVEDGYLAGKGVLSWNLLWIDYCMDQKSDDKIFDTYRQKKFISSNRNGEKGTKELNTNKLWGWAYHVLSKYYGNRCKTGLVFSLASGDSKNGTLGYIKFKFNEVKELMVDDDNGAAKEMESYRNLYGDKENEMALNKSFFDLVFGYYSSIEKVVDDTGGIGLKDLKADRVLPKFDIKKLKLSHRKWLLTKIPKTKNKEAMENAKEQAKKLANLFKEYADKDQNTTESRVVERQFFSDRNFYKRYKFIRCLTDNLLAGKNASSLDKLGMSDKKDELNDIIEHIQDDVDEFFPFLVMVQYYYYVSK